jgi:branched-chain amino acid transport system permease protein
MKSESISWVKIVQNGLLGGFIALLLCMVGMVVTFDQLFVINGVITTGQLFVLFPILFESYLTVRRIPQKSNLNHLLTGGLVGVLGGVVLTILVLLGQVINLQNVLVNVSPGLFALLTFHLPLATGILVLIIICGVIGIIGSGILLLPTRIRSALTQAILFIVILGTFRDLIYTVIIRWGFLQYALLWLFAQSGLSIIGSITIFVIVGGLVYWRTGKEKIMTNFIRSPSQQRMYKWGSWGFIAILILLLPIILGPYFSEILDNVGIYILMGLGLNIVVGFAGLLDLGYVAFYAIGAYTLGVFTTSEAVGLLHLSFWGAVPLAIIVAVFAGVVLGLPVLRMRGDYLAIVTLGFGEIIRILVLSDWWQPLLGGPGGIVHIAQPTIANFVFGDQQRLFYVILVGILIAGFIAIRLKDSHLGRSWMALREDEDVAEAMGINKVATKLLAFAMGALFSGLGGALFATKIGSVYPQSFSFIVSINILSLIIIGGMGSIPGVFIGGLALVGLPLLLTQFTDFRYLIYGAALVFMMLVKPEGLSPEARRRLELHEEKVEVPIEEPVPVLKTPSEQGGK